MLVAVSLVPAPAQAALERVGPNDPVTTLPTWFQDKTGITFELCTPLVQGELDGGYCLLLPGDTVAPEIFPGAFFDEHFYWGADAGGNYTYVPPVGVTVPFTTGRVVYVQAMEAAFLTGVRPGGADMFGRVRFRLDDLPLTGNYTFYSPYGVDVIAGLAGDRIFATEDIGCGYPNYECALQTRIGPFLLPSLTPGGAELPPVDGPVPGKKYIADPAVTHKVTGSPIVGNHTLSDGRQVNPNGLYIEAPDGQLIFETTDFSIIGRYYGEVIPSRLAVDRASYTRDASSIAVDTYATGEPTMSPRLSAAALQPPTQPDLSFYAAPCSGGIGPQGQLIPPFGPPAGETAIPMSRSGNVYWGETGAPAVPAAVCLVDLNARTALGDIVPVYVPGVLGDQVFVAEAIFDPSNGGSLSVVAASSDQLAPTPALALGAFGELASNVALVNGLAYVAPLAAPPAKVRVLSAERGVAELQVVTGSRTATGVTLAADLPSPQTPGIAVVFTAQGQGASNPQYRFWLDSGAGFQVVRDWSPTPMWIMNGATPEGHYQVQAEVWAGLTPSGPDAASNVVPYDRRLPLATGVAITADRVSPAAVNIVPLPTVFTAVGSGSTGGYQYRFSLIANSGAPALVQDYGVGSTWTMPASTPVGSYQVKVDVRTSTLVDQDTTNSLPFVLVAPTPATGVTVVATPTTPSLVGTSVSFTATGLGSTEGGQPSPQSAYEFRFWLNTGPGWVMVQDYGNGATYALASPAIGIYRVAVHVRARPGVAADFSGPALVHVVASATTPATGVSVAATPSSPSPTGTSVAFVATGLGSTENGLASPQSAYDFRFWLNTGTGWVMAQDYGAGATYTLPTPVDGTYQVAVHVRTSPLVASDFNGPAVTHVVATPTTPATGVSVAASPTSPSAAGASVTFTATGLGSTQGGLPSPQGAYSFRFWLNVGAGWVLAQDYGVGATYTLPTPAPGAYQVAVHVRTRTTVASDFNGPVLTHVVVTPNTPATGVSVAASPISPSLAGDTVTFTATGLGSTDGGLPSPQSAYDFRFWLNTGAGWVMAQDYGSGAVLTLAAPLAGTYQLAVHVRTSALVPADYYGPIVAHLVQ
ncbi:MAG: hypothetical protein IPQ24_12770 [Anaeromyxobacter sp.]|nr:hypothetical protein [Anaeromyxobacter sp.]